MGLLNWGKPAKSYPKDYWLRKNVSEHVAIQSEAVVSLMNMEHFLRKLNWRRVHGILLVIPNSKQSAQHTLRKDKNF